MTRRRLQKDREKRLVVRVFVNNVSPETITIVSIFLFAITLVGAFVCAGLAAIPHGDVHANSTIDFLGLLKVSTTDVGIGLVALGIGGFIFTISRVLKTYRALFG